MDRIFRLGAPALALALLFGCGTADDAGSTTPAPSAAPAVEPAKDEHATPAPGSPEAAAPIPPAAEASPGLEGPKGAAVKLTDDEIASIKKLPADEQAAALSQGLCPVSDEHLGAMDTPIKVTAEGRTFYLCCKGCEDAVAKDAKAVIAKLDQK